jgi:hypothetical protein
VVPDTGGPQARGLVPRVALTTNCDPRRHRKATHRPAIARHFQPASKETIMRGILLWAVGIPIPVIILLYLVHVI